MEDVIVEATQFIREYYIETGRSEHDCEKRVALVEEQLRKQGMYIHTEDELAHGARMAWRNSNRCIGRLFWESMHVLDKRDVTDEDDVAEALFEHLEYATNNGKAIPTITIFPQRQNDQDPVRIWNHQLIRYAGYQTEQGIVGDPDSIAFTDYCRSLGWKGTGSSYDLLPLVIQSYDNTPKWYEIPNRCILEVEISHPTIQEIHDLQLKWYAVPFISDMKLEVGGITYPAAPFNGWYMGTEIGARNLADQHRYNMLPEIATCMGLDQSRDSTLWKDKALVELNVAVLHSFKKAGVSIVDHHTAAKQFERFQQKEQGAGREVNGKWSWLIPPVSPATTSIFHQQIQDEAKKPTYLYQKRLY